jgi:hypothetical protein
VYFRESKNVAIEMTLNQGRLVQYLNAYVVKFIESIHVC